MVLHAGRAPGTIPAIVQGIPHREPLFVRGDAPDLRGVRRPGGTFERLREDADHPWGTGARGSGPARPDAQRRGLRHPVRMDMGRRQVPQRRGSLRERHRARILEGDRPALQELQPRRSRAGTVGGIRPRVRRRHPGRRRRLPHRGTGLQLLHRQGRHRRHSGPQRARRNHAACGTRNLRARRYLFRPAQDPAGGDRRGERGVHEHHRGRGDADHAD